MFNGERQQHRTSARNTLFLDVPGLSSNLQIRFPECRLPVCGRCKKNYKTRDMCRTQAEHTNLPWSTVFICVTLDHTCTNSNNTLKRGVFTSRNIDWMPYCFKSDVDAETLICAACKTKNYTRKQCRVKSRHRYLPWSTVYCVLSCESNDDGRSTTENDLRDLANELVQGKRRSVNEDKDIGPNKRRAVGANIPQALKSPGTYSDDESVPDNTSKRKKKLSDESDDIRKVDKSRTFLIKVDERQLVIKWLDIDKSKALPVQCFSSASNGQTTQLSSFPAQSPSLGSLYAPPQARLYQLPLENLHSSGRLHPLESQARQFMHQILPSTQGSYSTWQGSSNSPSMAHFPGNSSQFSDVTATDYPPSWYQKHYDTQTQLQAQPSARNWTNLQTQRFDMGQMMTSNMLPLQQGRAGVSARAASYQDFEHENGQYNMAEPHYMFVPRQEGC